MIRTEILIELMTRAAAQPLGLVLEVTNPKRFVVDSKVRVGAQFPNLMFCIPSTENTVFIVQKSVELDP